VQTVLIYSANEDNIHSVDEVRCCHFHFKIGKPVLQLLSDYISLAVLWCSTKLLEISVSRRSPSRSLSHVSYVVDVTFKVFRLATASGCLQLMGFSEQVLDGERITMALWFTRDSKHDEDKKIIDQLINVMPLLLEKQDNLCVSQVKESCGENTGVASQLSQVNMFNWGSKILTKQKKGANASYYALVQGLF